MKKRLVSFGIIAMLLLCLAACGEKSAIQEATGATAEQGRAIEQVLKDAGVGYEMIVEATHNRPESIIPEQYTVYNVLDKDANNFFLVLGEENQVLMLMDSEGEVLYGSIPAA